MKSSPVTRRTFIQTTAATGASIVAAPVLGRYLQDTRLRVLSIGVVGTIGGQDRKTINNHASADIVGLCDVDARFLAEAANDHPDAFTCEDYREAFDRHGDKFDAIIVATPDHSHCAIMTMALAHG